MSKKKIIAVVFIAVAAVAGYYAYKQVAQSEEEKGVYYGNVDTRTVVVGFRFVGIIDSVLKDEGQSVAQGEPLVYLDPRDINATLQQAIAQLQASKSELKKLEAGYRFEDVNQAKAAVNAANARVGETKDTLERLSKLIKSNATSKQSYVDAKSAYTQAKAELARAEAAYRLQKSGFRSEEIAAQRHVVKAMEANVNKLEVDLENTVIYSPVNGVILTRYKEPGSVVNPGEPVLEIAKSDELWVRAYVDEPNFGDIRPGQKVWVFTDSSSKPYEGFVGFISPVAEFTPKQIQTAELRTDLVYRFRVVVKNPDEKLRQGMPATVKVKR